ncbi:hypothetical protein HMPREF9075_02236 [Capnocytophaga sp. oral taxon 332 str. F0381]|jgi:lipoprotein|uniref:hypothetical protein n=1 Tax=Capnocytophaga sp. oral taxon 332 TaxID=712213 RepID=UPI0002A26E12|nr:hypothetical protein [Capnocytophaga sp. oral taxon 332]EKY06826.1 hypothetical protein HMPREF9075_02236 [Capnocytophaga sp. oral taxon 332 str. F0381]
MKKIILVLVAFSISCTNTNRKVVIKDHITVNNKEAGSLLVGENQEVRNVVYNFYNWYVNDIYLKNKEYLYSPSFKKLSKGKYGLDIEKYAKHINSITFFSTKYKKFLIDRTVKCNSILLEKKWDFNPLEEYYDFEDCQECDFIVKEYWFGSQEEKNGNFSIKNEYKTEGEAFLYYVQDYIDNEVFSTYEIKVVKENNLYKIDFISVM